MGTQPASLDVLQALLFYPRGGSAQVIRYLTAALTEQETDCRIISGSHGQPGDATHAPTFFHPLPVAVVDYTSALEAAGAGGDPLREPVPLHPSFEDRENVPDRAFTSVDPDTGAFLESRWEAILEKHVKTVPDIFHVHHLSPIQAAVHAKWPETPLIGHIHGTELKMLSGIATRTRIVSELGFDFETDSRRIAGIIETGLDALDEDDRRVALRTRWASWRYAPYWQTRLRQYASLCDRLIVLTEDACVETSRLLDFDPEKIHPVPNGVDIDRFTPVHLSSNERLARWRHWLVEDPQGWDETGVPGSVRYRQDEVDTWFMDDDGNQSPVLLYVGRFTRMKRVPMLIRAYKRAQAEFNWPAPLVIWGGNPGEWEGQHPVTVAQEESVQGVFFVGWRGHEELPSGLNAADVMIAPSTNEPFGQVYLEAMACRIPVIGTLSGGPPTFINRDDNALDGWLVTPDDEIALAAAIVEAVNCPERRKARGENAYRSVRSEHSWTQVARTVRGIYDDVVSSRHPTIAAIEPGAGSD